MPAKILFAGRPDQWPVYQKTLTTALDRANVAGEILEVTDDANAVDYIVYAPNGPIQDFTPYTRLKAVFSLWAGVESFQDNATLKVPLARMVDQGLTAGMTEWVLGHVMRYHLGIDGHIHGQDGVWRNHIVPPLARDRRVGILGLGALGAAAAQALHQIGFQVSGFSRHKKTLEGIATFTGNDGLRQVLETSEILVLLLPLTPETENILNAQSLALLPKGAFIINPGHGPLIDDDAFLAALETDQIAHATLDVFRKEPLPANHAYWAHPKVTVTPHIASETRPETASEAIVENIRRGEAGLPFQHLVDRTLGY